MRLRATRTGDSITLEVQVLQAGWKALRVSVVGYDAGAGAHRRPARGRGGAAAGAGRLDVRGRGRCRGARRRGDDLSAGVRCREFH